MPNALENSIAGGILMAQEKGQPEKVYRKAIMGKLVVKIVDPFSLSGDKAELLIEGDPNKVDASDIEINLWTPFEVQYFERFNKGLIEKGSLVRVDKPTDFVLKDTNAMSDEELKETATAPFFTLTKTLSEITSETTLQRLLKTAKDLSRPSKTIQTIELRIEELQQGG